MGLPSIIVGAGAAGLAAALRAASLGCPTLVLERDSGVPSNTAASGGLFAAAGTRFQAAAGIADSPALLCADIVAQTGGAVDRPVLEAVCRRSADMAHFLADHAGLALHVRQGGLYAGSSVHRLHATPDESGVELAASLRRAAAAARGIDLRDPAEVIGLAVEQDRVVGVELAGRAGTMRADTVVLACGGYGAAPDLLQLWCPEIAGAIHVGGAASRGDAVRWGERLGAELQFMTAYQGHRADPATGLRLGAELPALGAILLNRDGSRFAREDRGPSEFAAIILAQPGGVVIEAFDRHAFETVKSLGPFRAAVAAGAVRRADDAAGLARAFELPAAPVVAELAALGPGRAAGPDRFGRSLAHRPPFEPPYFGMRMTGVLAHTQGGLRIDDAARVLRADGRPIAGLYAAGASAAGISGISAAGYVPGNGLCHALTTGFIAGETIAGARAG